MREPLSFTVMKEKLDRVRTANRLDISDREIFEHASKHTVLALRLRELTGYTMDELIQFGTMATTRSGEDPETSHHTLD